MLLEIKRDIITEAIQDVALHKRSNAYGAFEILMRNDGSKIMLKNDKDAVYREFKFTPDPTKSYKYQRAYEKLQLIGMLFEAGGDVKIV